MLSTGWDYEWDFLKGCQEEGVVDITFFHKGQSLCSIPSKAGEKPFQPMPHLSSLHCAIELQHNTCRFVCFYIEKFILLMALETDIVQSL